jgi:hypothetical protein
MRPTRKRSPAHTVAMSMDYRANGSHYWEVPIIEPDVCWWTIVCQA